MWEMLIVVYGRCEPNVAMVGSRGNDFRSVIYATLVMKLEHDFTAPDRERE